MKNGLLLLLFTVLVLGSCSPEQEQDAGSLVVKEQEKELTDQEIELVTQAIVKGILESNCH